MTFGQYEIWAYDSEQWLDKILVNLGGQKVVKKEVFLGPRVNKKYTLGHF